MLSNVIDFATERTKRIKPVEDQSFYSDSLKAFFKLPLGNDKYCGHHKDALYTLFGDFKVLDNNILYRERRPDSDYLSTQVIYFLLERRDMIPFSYPSQIQAYICICSGNNGRFSYSDRYYLFEKAQKLYMKHINDINIKNFKHIWPRPPFYPSGVWK